MCTRAHDFVSDIETIVYVETATLLSVHKLTYVVGEQMVSTLSLQAHLDRNTTVFEFWSL